MKRSSKRWSGGAGACVAAAVWGGGLGCEPSNSVPGGPPVLLELVAVDPGTGPFDAVTEPITADGPAFPARPLLLLVFDRLLDPTPLLDVDPDGGALQSKQGIASIDSSNVGVVDTAVDYFENGFHEKGLVLR